jgi:hypothetical protein
MKSFSKWGREVGVQKMFLARRKTANVRKVGTEVMMRLKTLVQTYEETRDYRGECKEK